MMPGLMIRSSVLLVSDFLGASAAIIHSFIHSFIHLRTTAAFWTISHCVYNIYMWNDRENDREFECLNGRELVGGRCRP